MSQGHNWGGLKFLRGRSDIARSDPLGNGALRRDKNAPAERYDRALHKEDSAIPERSNGGGALRGYWSAPVGALQRA